MNKFHLLFSLLFFTTSLKAQVQISGIINSYTKVTAIESTVCQSRIMVQDTTGLAEGDLALLIQMQGANINETNSSSFGNISNLNQAGLYEINVIDSVVDFKVYLKYQLENDYDVNGKVQLIEMPAYKEAVITNTLTAEAWNGETGGVLAFRVENELIANADIDVSGLGFRGGITQTAATNNCTWLFQQNNFFYEFGNWRGAAKGEGIASIIVDKEFGKGAQANGGGGGNDHNSGGGGGANVTNGGQGGENFEPQAFGCQGGHPGVGGKGIMDNASRLFLGGGGGAGHDNNGVATNGANGGGIVIMLVNDYQANGHAIFANGITTEDGGGDGAGGGGAGGSILLEVQSLWSPIQIEAKGGNGGLVQNNGERCHGPGGGGSGGRVVTNLMDADTISIQLDGGLAGMSINSSSCGNGNNGAQNGADGVLESINNIILAENQFPFPEANFSFEINMDTVVFTNLSENANTQVWNFGDEETSTEVSPTYVYSTSGTFEVELIISSACGNDTLTQMLTIIPPPSGDFTSTTPGGCAPWTVTFTNQSMGAIDSYNWTFEGGTPATSSDENPEVVYNSAGVFDVELEVIGAGGADTVLLENAITVTPAVTAGFDFLADESTVSFMNTSMNATSYQWDFGDGSAIVSVANPLHTYEISGTYEVTLTAISDFCEMTFSQMILVDFVNLEELEKLQLKIYPNPVNDFLKIETDLNQEMELKIYTVDGKLIDGSTQSFFSSLNLEVSNFASGVYFLTIAGVENIARYKMVKE